ATCPSLRIRPTWCCFWHHHWPAISVGKRSLLPAECRLTWESEQMHHTRTPAAVEFFYVGGHYEVVDAKPAYHHSAAGPGKVMVGQVYVEHHIAPRRTAPYPVVVVAHGGSIMWFKRTPDGRSGWANYFLEQGFDLYLVNQVDPSGPEMP